MSTQRISTLARERWQSGAHASHHLRVHPDVIEWMRGLPTERQRDPLLRGIPVVIDDELREGEWRLQPSADRYGAPAEWGFIGNPECEHHEPADVTTLADVDSRIHWYCGCGAHWFNLSPHAQLRYEPVREPAP